MTAAFTSTVLSQTVAGDKAIAYGTYASSGGAVGGDIDTGLSNAEIVVLQPRGTSVATNASVVNETFPANTGSVTIVTDANQVGGWIAIGTA